IAELAGVLEARVEPVLIPWDCADGFFEAYWRRPGAYLEEPVRRATPGWGRRPSSGPSATSRPIWPRGGGPNGTVSWPSSSRPNWDCGCWWPELSWPKP